MSTWSHKTAKVMAFFCMRLITDLEPGRDTVLLPMFHQDARLSPRLGWQLLQLRLEASKP